MIIDLTWERNGFYWIIDHQRLVEKYQLCQLFVFFFLFLLISSYKRFWIECDKKSLNQSKLNKYSILFTSFFFFWLLVYFLNFSFRFQRWIKTCLPELNLNHIKYIIHWMNKWKWEQESERERKKNTRISINVNINANHLIISNTQTIINNTNKTRMRNEVKKNTEKKIEK